MIPESGANRKHPKSGGGEEPKSTPGKPSQGGGGAPAPETESEGKPAGANGGAGKGGGGGAKPAGAGERAATAVGPAQDLGGSPKADAPTHSGGSSPLLPVLIAVALLAALSFGAVIYRQRRHLPVG